MGLVIIDPVSATIELDLGLHAQLAGVDPEEVDGPSSHFAVERVLGQNLHGRFGERGQGQCLPREWGWTLCKNAGTGIVIV